MSEDIIKQAQDKWKRDESAWSEIYSKAREDLHFLSDDPYSQWDKADYDARTLTGRPAITIDQLGQFIHQVANDIRMNTPTINVIPGDGSNVKTAEIFKGLIRNIEYVSNADDAYDTGALNAVKSSIGFIRVDHDYVDDDSFEQELLIKRVTNPLACLLDSDSVECDGRDAKHGTIIDKILVSDFKKMYPGKDAVSFEGGKISEKDDEYIAIAEHFVIEEGEEERGLNELGEIVPIQKGYQYKSTRKIKKTVIKRYKLSGADVLEQTTFPGKYIPLVPVYGEEAWVEGKRNLFSLIRKSKQAQKMYNYWKSLETELLMKAPKAPVMAPEGSTEDYKDDWTDPDKSAVLRYKQNGADGTELNKPERLPPPPIPTGIINAARETVDDIKATMGIYNASLGQRSNEQSGVAIKQRQAEGDVATYHFGDNLVRSITHVGRILVCAIPEIYDTPRIIRIIGEEDEPKAVGINGEMAEDQEEAYNLAEGKYDVKVITGAPFSTMRQEAAEVFMNMITTNPELMSVMGDLAFKYADHPGSQAMADRMKKVIDPKFLDEKSEADPEKEQLKAQVQEAQMLMQQMQAEIQKLAEGKEIEAAKVQIDGQKAQVDAQSKEFELELKAKELELKQAEFQAKYELENKKIDADLTKTRISAKQSASPDVAMTDPEMHESGVAPMAQMMETFANVILQSNENTSQNIQELAQTIAIAQAEGQQELARLIAAPRRPDIIRDPNTGNIKAGVSTIQ
jgi:hypothetical protein